MEEFVPAWDTFLIAAENDFFDEGQRLSRVLQQTGFFVVGHAFRRVRLAMKVGVSFQYHHAVRIVFRQHIGPGTHRVPVQGDIFFRQSGLGIKTLRLPWNGSEKGHRQPVHELGIFTLDLDAVGMRIYYLRAFQREVVEIQIGVFIRSTRLPRGGLQRCGIFLKTDDVIGHQAENRGMQLWMRQSFNLKNIILSREFARAAIGKIAQLIYAQPSPLRPDRDRRTCPLRFWQMLDEAGSGYPA